MQVTIGLINSLEHLHWQDGAILPMPTKDYHCFCLSYSTPFIDQAVQQWYWPHSHSLFACLYGLDSVSVHITTSRRFKCVFLKWVIPLEFWAWRLSLFLWALRLAVAENVSATFGFIRFEKGEIFWKKIRKQAEVTSKDWNNSEIKLPEANEVVNVFFCS